MTDALPMTMPSIVNIERRRFAFRVAKAIPTVSRMGSLAGIAGSASVGLF